MMVAYVVKVAYRGIEYLIPKVFLDIKAAAFELQKAIDDSPDPKKARGMICECEVIE